MFSTAPISPGRAVTGVQAFLVTVVLVQLVVFVAASLTQQR
jgi:hypothetical protein